MEIKTEDLINDIARFIARDAPRVSKDKLFLRKVLEVMGIFIPKVPSELKYFDKLITDLRESYTNIQWFNYKGLWGVVAQCSTTKEVALKTVMYCPDFMGTVIIVPEEQQLLLELYYLLSQGLSIPNYSPQEMVMIALLLKVGTLDQKVEALLKLGIIDPSDTYPETLITNMAAVIIGEN